VQRWCDRRLGIGADGVLVVTAVDDQSVGMEYWNADGSAAEMCGNGLRCVARYSVDRGLVPGPEFGVSTDAGRRRVIVGPRVVRAELGPVQAGEDSVELAGYDLATVSVGNPHAVRGSPQRAHRTVCHRRPARRRTAGGNRRRDCLDRRTSQHGVRRLTRRKRNYLTERRTATTRPRISTPSSYTIGS
jgi:diaminopimelate epimerase